LPFPRKGNGHIIVLELRRGNRELDFFYAFLGAEFLPEASHVLGFPLHCEYFEAPVSGEVDMHGGGDDAFRSFISEYKWAFSDTEEIAGAIMLIYYLDKPGLLNQIVEIQHSFEGVV